MSAVAFLVHVHPNEKTDVSLCKSELAPLASHSHTVSRLELCTADLDVDVQRTPVSFELDIKLGLTKYYTITSSIVVNM